MEAADAYDLVSEKYDIALFIEEQRSDPAYQQILKGLQGAYCAVRRTRADGSCFYRGLGFAFLESLAGRPQDTLRFRERVTQSGQDLLAAGFPDHGHHYRTFLSLVDTAGSSSSSGSGCDLLRAFNRPEVSDSAVQYLRLVTSAFIRSRADFYQPFIAEAKRVDDFCTEVVEPMMMECDHIQISALTQALDIPLLVEHACADGATRQHVFSDGSSPRVHMLYKQNHYNLLYRPGEV